MYSGLLVCADCRNNLHYHFNQGNPEIKRLTKFASHYEDDFVKAVMGSSQQSVALDRKLKEKELAALQARDEELDGLFERIYEDNVSGKFSDDRFPKMSRRYEDEQKEISERIKPLRAEMDNSYHILIIPYYQVKNISLFPILLRFFGFFRDISIIHIVRVIVN